MAYNFLGLVNDVNNRLNEVQLTSTNFSGAVGYYGLAKDAVNSSIRHINQEEYEWPWNHVQEELVLAAGTMKYSYSPDVKTINMNSFRTKRDDSLSIGTDKLKSLVYEEWIEKYADDEFNTSASIRGIPTHIIRTPGRELICHPVPDKAYTIVYEYYTLGYDLENALDVPPIPEQYRFAIVEGAMYYAYQFRGDTQSAQLALQKFEEQIKYLRSININRTPYLRDTRVHF